MVYENCPMMGGYGLSIFYLNWIIIAVIFAVIFWGAYYSIIKKSQKKKQ
jgi:uncharacterized membrane protein